MKTTINKKIVIWVIFPKDDFFNFTNFDKDKFDVYFLGNFSKNRNNKNLHFRNINFSIINFDIDKELQKLPNPHVIFGFTKNDYWQNKGLSFKKWESPEIGNWQIESYRKLEKDMSDLTDVDKKKHFFELEKKRLFAESSLSLTFRIFEIKKPKLWFFISEKKSSVWEFIKNHINAKWTHNFKLENLKAISNHKLNNDVNYENFLDNAKQQIIESFNELEQQE